jgi:hypothetical protein
MTKITSKEAIKSAKEYAEDTILKPEDNNMSINEIRMSDDEKNWIITLGWDEKREQDPEGRNGVISSLYGPFTRIYRTFYIDSETGDFVKMETWSGDDE